MGPKKLKRKKLKLKTLEKLLKLKGIKRKKKLMYELCKSIDFVENSIEGNVHDNRLSSISRSYLGEENVTDLKYFSKVREDYFSYLQTVISDNCVFHDFVLTKKVVQNLALELEQSALLVCLQVDIYKKAMSKIIEGIKKSTEDKQVHEDVKKLLSHSSQKDDEKVLATTPPASLAEAEIYNKIPTIAGTRTDDNLIKNSVWINDSSYSSSQYYLGTEHCQQYREDQNEVNSTSCIWNDETYPSLFCHTSYYNDEVPKTSDCDLEIVQNGINSQSSAVPNNFSELNKQENCIVSDNPMESRSPKESIDPLLQSRNQLQKLVEQTLNETEKANKEKKEKQERDYIAQILEGEDSMDNRLNDSLSDNENESKENIDESNFIDRLEKMRELFGLEEESSADFTIEKQKTRNKINNLNSRRQRTSIWKYEKFINLHKYSLIASEMTYQRRKTNRKLFLELFGEDSDEEHETEYSCEEKYRSSCTERISSWVVKYLMPFYLGKRIIGRELFKSLGHYISGCIIDEIQYPDEWTVKYYVSKFFPPKKKYVCNEDILNFQLD